MELTLSTAAASGETVTVTYTPGTNRLQDVAGNDAFGLTSQELKNYADADQRQAGVHRRNDHGFGR